MSALSVHFYIAFSQVCSIASRPEITLISHSRVFRGLLKRSAKTHRQTGHVNEPYFIYPKLKVRITLKYLFNKKNTKLNMKRFLITFALSFQLAIGMRWFYSLVKNFFWHLVPTLQTISAEHVMNKTCQLAIELTWFYILVNKISCGTWCQYFKQFTGVICNHKICHLVIGFGWF